MISEKDDTMFRDAHEKWSLIVNEWDTFKTLDVFKKQEFVLNSLPDIAKYHARCSFCERYIKEQRVPCLGCPLNKENCLNENSLYYKAFSYNKKYAAEKILKIIDAAWKKAWNK